MTILKIPNIPPVAAVLLAIVSVQGGAAIAKSIFPVLGAVTTATFRIGLSALFLLFMFRPQLDKLSSAQWKAVIPFGLSLGAMNLIFYLSIERIPVGLAVTLEFIGPLLLAVFSSRRASDFVWILIAAAGIALIAPWNEHRIDITGALLALLAGGFWAAYILLGGKVSKIMDGNQAVAVGMIFASLLVMPFGFTSPGLQNFTPGLIFALCAIAILSSAIPFLLEMNALKVLPAQTFSILMSMEPAIAALSAMVFLGEHLKINEWLAIALVISASAGAALTKRRNDKKAETQIPH
ncbi:DMT family transporter [Daejeonella sp. JGW-45]|uniref:EamA family transporter n=1 Tax=Daejeonella sp. JGW-45 TaxID=3034148 RepID=UPI0023EBDE2F|nr:DMT family transporter [Daejeonella sp. JGW-45]